MSDSQLVKHIGDKTRHLLLIVLTYSLWLVAAAIAFGIMHGVRTLTLVGLPIAGVRDRWVLRAIDKFGTVILGILWLVFVIASEAYFRPLYKKEFSVRRVLRFFGAELLVLGVVYGGIWLIRIPF